MDRSLLLSCILLQISFCILAASGQLIIPAQLNFSAAFNFTPTITPNSDGIGLIVDGNLTTCQLVAKYSVGDPGPVCFLQVISKAAANTSYWTKPCPRTPQQLPPDHTGFWCKFTFENDGNLLLESGTNVSSFENGTVLWTSNTTGSGAITLELLDSDIESLGHLVLYDANKQIVWDAIVNNPDSEDYRCTTSTTQAPPPPAARKLLQHWH